MTTVRASEVFGPLYEGCAGRLELAPSWGPSSARLLAVVVELLPKIDDDLLADLIEQLAVTLVARDERVRAIREVESVTLDELHRTQRENRHLHNRVIELVETFRRRAAA